MLQRTVAVRVPPSESAASPKAVARLQGGKNNFVAVLVGFDDACPAGDENIKSVRRFALPDEKVSELVILLLQEGTQLFEVFLRVETEKADERRRRFSSVAFISLGSREDAPLNVTRGQVREVAIENAVAPPALVTTGSSQIRFRLCR